MGYNRKLARKSKVIKQLFAACPQKVGKTEKTADDHTKEVGKGVDGGFDENQQQ